METNAYKVGIDDDFIRKIFMELNDLDTNLNLINRLSNNDLATPFTARALNIDLKEVVANYSKPIDPIGNTPNCQNYGCFWCSPGGNCDCTEACTYVPNACGITGTFDCHAICCPSI